MTRIRTEAVPVAALFLLCAVVAWPQPQRGGQRGGQRGQQGPPPEAIEACEDLNEGDECRFESPRGEVTGTCRMPPNDDSEGGLACVPNDRSRGGGRPDRGGGGGERGLE